MKDMFNFDNLRSKELIVLEVANNHQGDLKHGIRLIDEFSLVSRKYFNDFDFAIKFQYRDLSTFVHKQYIDSDIKYVKRFLETKLNTEEWKTLIKRVEESNLITMCTPFDEISVDNVIKDDFEILKIVASFGM